MKLANKRRKDVVESFDKAVEASDEAIDALTKAESKGKAFENGTIPWNSPERTVSTEKIVSWAQSWTLKSGFLQDAIPKLFRVSTGFTVAWILGEISL